MDLDGYQIALEEVLTWLLSAEDTFQEQDDISDDVEEVKDQFATHEVKKPVAHEHDIPTVMPVPNHGLYPDVCLLNSVPYKRHGLFQDLDIFK